MMRRLATVGLIAVPLVLVNCGDDEGTTTETNGGGSGGDGGDSSGMQGGSSGANTAGASAGTASTAGSDQGGSASAGGGAGGASNDGGDAGQAGSGGSAGAGGQQMVRVYTIDGCSAPAVDGDAGASDAGASDAGMDASAPPPLPNVFASFTIYDFETDRPVQTCVDRIADFSVTVTGDAPLTVVANIAPGVSPASVVWTYDDVAQEPHNIFPYALGPDDNGDYDAPDPELAPGEHTLSITAYSQMDGMGTVLGQATVVLTVIDGDA